MRLPKELRLIQISVLWVVVWQLNPYASHTIFCRLFKFIFINSKQTSIQLSDQISEAY
jgi:hypothetical protein